MATKIPHPPRKFLVGNLPQIAGDDTMTKMIQLGYDYGPIFEIAVLNIKLLFITNFELAKEILADEERFPKYLDVPVQHLRVIAGDGLFTAWTHEPNWKKAHNILMPGFSQRSMRGYVPAMKGIVDRLLEKWEAIPTGKYINLSDDMTRYTFETIGLCGFDYNFGSFESEKEHDFIPAMLFALDEAVQRARVPPFMLPFRFSRNKAFKKHLSYVNNLIDEIIAKRKANPKAYTNKFDFLSLMMNAHDKETGEQLSDENIRYQILTFMVAGHETTSGLLSFVFYNLLTHTEWLEKVYEEVDRVLGADIEQPITHRELSKMKVIRQVLLETLRLYSPVPIINVAPTEATTIGKEKYPVQKQQSVLIWPYHLHRDKTIWGEDPEAFNPDHFLPENIAKRDKDAFKAFGNGKRACIGRQFAMTEATLALAMILQRYKLHLKPDYKFGFNETITLRPFDLYVRLERRTEADRYHLVREEEEKIATASSKATQQHHTPLLVLYGSNMGSSEEIAYQLVKDGRELGFDVTMATLDAYVGRLPKSGFVQIVCSTYNGTPPDNARRFSDWLATCKDDFSGLNISIFGCGNSQWTTYQAFPNAVHNRLLKLGARSFYPKGEADASLDFDAQFEKWYGNYWKTVLKGLKLGIDVSIKNTALKVQKIVHGPSYKCPNFIPDGFQQLEIKEQTELQNVALSGRSTKHIKITIPTGLSYQVGDYLLVQPRNPKALIDRIYQRFGLDPNDYYLLTGTNLETHLPIEKPILLDDLLTHFVELQHTVTRRQLKLLIENTSCPPEKMQLQQYDQQFELEILAKKRSLLGLLEEFKACEMSFELFLEQLPQLQPRYYSIASSPKAFPKQLSLTVGVLNKNNYQGVCSNYLSGSLDGQRIFGMVKRPNVDFSLPEKVDTPIIMIAAGTGIAPFRGFVQELHVKYTNGDDLGTSVLFFGCRHPEQDFLYKDELQNAEKEGVIKLHTAFSRQDPTRKIYVQDLLLKEKALVWELLEQNGVIYVCGDAAGMAKGVEETLMTIYKENKGAEAGEQWLESLRKTGRYKLEIWTS